MRAGAVAVGGSPPSALAEFEEVYRSNVDVVMAYFARRCADPQAVADLTSETFVRAAGAFGSFDPRRGSARAWLFGIAAHVFRELADKKIRMISQGASEINLTFVIEEDEVPEVIQRLHKTFFSELDPEVFA